ncbi:F-box/kelch-repeat protein At3g24760 [Linum perenne]
MSEPFSYISTDLTELILSHLPIPSLVRASAVCSFFCSLISSPTFPSLPQHRRLPWFFLQGLHNTSSKYNQSFGFDPLSNSWFHLPFSSPSLSPDFIGSGGFLFTTAPSFSFSPLLIPRWKSTSPLRFSRINPLVGVFSDAGTASRGCHFPPNSNVKFVVVGGSRFIGGLAVEIYDPRSDSWDLCSPLPEDFHTGNLIYVFNEEYHKGYPACVCEISSIDSGKYSWRRLPQLPSPVNEFHKVVSFCSTVFPGTLFGGEYDTQPSLDEAPTS